MFVGLLCADHVSPLQYGEPAQLGAALAPFHRPDREGVWQAGGALLLAQRTFNAAASRDERLPLIDPASGIALAFWGRLDNRTELAAALRLAPAGPDTLLDSELVLSAWRAWGEALPERLQGDFALAVVDAGRRRLFLARDALGAKPLYYRGDASVFAFASSVAALKVLRGLPLTPDRRWMSQYLLELSMSHDRTGYSEVMKLPPGHALTWQAGQEPVLRRWHDWRDDSPVAGQRSAHWVADYREALDESIRCRMASEYPLGTENSGGVDSATITMALARELGVPGDRLYGFSQVLGEQEPASILEVSHAAGLRHNYLFSSPELVESMPDALIDRSLRVLGYPEEHIMGSMHTPIYREAALHGIRTLHSGFGGDEVVTNHGLQTLLEMRDAGRYGVLQDMLQGNGAARRLRAARMMLAAPKAGAGRIDPAAAALQRWWCQLLRPEVIAGYDLSAGLLTGMPGPLSFRRTNDYILRCLLAHGYVAQRLEACTLLAASWGVEYRWPLLDARLIQQYLSTPGIEKFGPRGKGRYLHRRAVSDLVPERILWRQRKDMGYDRFLQDIQARRMKALPACLDILLEDLHPTLVDMVDVVRMKGLKAGLHLLERSRWLKLEKTLQALRWLDAWLKTAPGG